MTDTNHSPGPWVIINGVDMRNPALLMAAPDLLAAAKAALERLEEVATFGSSFGDVRLIAQLKDAIAKAEVQP